MKRTNVLGIVFDEEGKHALTFRAEKPYWKDAALDGLVAIVSRNMTAAGAMRDVGVAAGLAVQWEQFLRFSFVDCELTCYVSVTPLRRLRKLNAGPAGKPYLIHLAELPTYRLLPVLSWLIPMARFHAFHAPFDRIGFLQCQHEERIAPDPLTGARKAAQIG